MAAQKQESVANAVQTRRTSDDGPLVSLGLVLVVGPAGLQQGLVRPATACNQTNHGSAVAVDGLLRARRQANASHALLGVLRHDDRVVARRASHLAAITHFGLDVANHRAFGDLLARKDISDGECGYGAILVLKCKYWFRLIIIMKKKVTKENSNSTVSFSTYIIAYYLSFRRK